MITKHVVTGLIQVLENGVLQVREDTVIAEDGVEILRQYFRYVLEPGDPVAEKSQRIQDIAAAVWTTDVVIARRAERERIHANAPQG